MTEALHKSPSDSVCATTDELTAGIVSAYVTNNTVPASELPKLVSSVRNALLDGAAPAISETAEPAIKVSAAEIKRSITQNALISFIDGKGYKTLKRHLGAHGLNPDTYRARYGLGVDYPMVAPGYSEKRSQLAKQVGLGVGGRPRP